MNNINFNDPVVFQQLETDCWNYGRVGKYIDYNDFPAAEFRYFERLCKVYNRYSNQELTLDEAKAEKTKLKAQYLRDIESHQRYAEHCCKHQEYIKQSSDLCAEITKDDYPIQKTLIIALRIISNMRCESVTERSVLRRLKLDG